MDWVLYWRTEIIRNLTMDYEILMRIENDYDLNIKFGHNAC